MAVVGSFQHPPPPTIQNPLEQWVSIQIVNPLGFNWTELADCSSVNIPKALPSLRRPNLSIHRHPENSGLVGFEWSKLLTGTARPILELLRPRRVAAKSGNNFHAIPIWSFILPPNWIQTHPFPLILTIRFPATIQQRALKGRGMKDNVERNILILSPFYLFIVYIPGIYQPAIIQLSKSFLRLELFCCGSPKEEWIGLRLR